MKDLKYSEILARNQELGTSLPEDGGYEICVISNVIVNQIKEILEYYLRVEGISATVKIGDYDNVVQDSIKYKDSNLVIIFWELCNLVDGLQHKSEIMSDDEIEGLETKTISELNLVFENLKSTSLVLCNRFSPLCFRSGNIGSTKLEMLSGRLNEYLERRNDKNLRVIDIDKIMAITGVQNSIDLRYFYSSKSIYSVDYYKAYAKYILPYIMAINGKSKKALIFDCDNTLWKGVVGEDGMTGIDMSPTSNAGVIFSEVQKIALSLNQEGVILGVCSKNNLSDVEKVFYEHPDMLIRNEALTIKKINWKDKVSNLKEISQELNVGLDSIVYVDDSSFEVNLIRQQLPEIMVVQVPKKTHEYPEMINSLKGLFYTLSKTKEDYNKVQLYAEQTQRVKKINEYANIEDYLSTLSLIMTIYVDEITLASRLAQLCQKTNQFNLTTKRHSEGNILEFIEDDSVYVMAIKVSDNFGDSGITGLCIFNINRVSGEAEIDTLLMSCRVIGRNIEFALMDSVMNKIKLEGATIVKATYSMTLKNEQVKDFYERCSFNKVSSNEEKFEYLIEVDKYKPRNLDYIEVKHGK